MVVGDFDCCKANEEDGKDVSGERSAQEAIRTLGWTWQSQNLVNGSGWKLPVIVKFQFLIR